MRLPTVPPWARRTPALRLHGSQLFTDPKVVVISAIALDSIFGYPSWPAVVGYVWVGVLPERVEVRVRGDHHVADCGVKQRRIRKSSMLVPATTQVG